MRGAGPPVMAAEEEAGEDEAREEEAVVAETAKGAPVSGGERSPAVRPSRAKPTPIGEPVAPAGETGRSAAERIAAVVMGGGTMAVQVIAMPSPGRTRRK